MARKPRAKLLLKGGTEVKVQIGSQDFGQVKKQDTIYDIPNSVHTEVLIPSLSPHMHIPLRRIILDGRPPTSIHTSSAAIDPLPILCDK